MTYEEMGTTLQWKKNLLFAGIFIQENLLHTVFDRYNTMSCKQWLLMSVLKAFDTPPDLSAAAKSYGLLPAKRKTTGAPIGKRRIYHTGAFD